MNAHSANIDGLYIINDIEIMK